MKIVTPSDDAEIRNLLETPSNIILDFYADWCGPCKVITKSFQAIKKDNLFKDITLIKIDIGKFNDLAKEYNVKSLPTVVYTSDDSGERKNLKTKIGSMNKSDLIQLIGTVYEK